ncbi:hypothetical protein PFISCL1PPCAC_22739, partial [Pristionchus fissidentatus]
FFCDEGMDPSTFDDEVWWGEGETNRRGNVDGLKERADHLGNCINLFLNSNSGLPLGLVAEWSQRANYAKQKVTEASGEVMSEQKRQIKTAEERRAQADKRRIVRDRCARCALPFGRPELGSRILWRLEVRGGEEEEGEEGTMTTSTGVDQRLVAVCEGCEQVHAVGRVPRLRGEKRKGEEEEEEERDWDTKSVLSIGGASTAASSCFGSEQKRKTSVSSLCSTPSQFSVSSASPLIVSAAAKKSAKKKRGSELSRLLRESDTSKKEEAGGGLAAFLSSLS